MSADDIVSEIDQRLSPTRWNYRGIRRFLGTRRRLQDPHECPRRRGGIPAGVFLIKFLSENGELSTKLCTTLWITRHLRGYLIMHHLWNSLIKEARIHSTLRLHASALSSRRPTILSTKRDGAFCRYACGLSPREIQCIRVNPKHFI